ALEVVMRMLRMERVHKDMLGEVERVLRVEFMSNIARTNRRDPNEQMAEIFNQFDRATEVRFLASLEERNHDAAEKIRSLMFTFDDLERLDPASVQALLREAQKDTLITALKGASDQLRDLFFANMSERAARLLREDMAAMGPLRLKDVEAAQRDMIAVAKALAERGTIVLANGDRSDELI